LAPAVFTLQWIVESVGTLLFQLEERDLTYTCSVVICCCEFNNVDYLGLRYLNNGALPFKEFSEDWLFDGMALCTFTMVTGCGEG
jgi:hypothetical protein